MADASVADHPAAPRPTPRRRVPRRTLFDYWLDLSLLVIFTVDYTLEFTGLAWHEWIGLAFVVLVPVHLLQHWDWVVRTTRRIVGRRPGRETLRWVVDLAILPGMVLCVASGLFISRHALPALGVSTERDRFWSELHSVTADLTLFLAIVHVALSWRWLLSVTRRVVRGGGAS